MVEKTKIMNLIVEIFNRVSDNTKDLFIEFLINEYHKTGNDNYLDIVDKLSEQKQAEGFQSYFDFMELETLDF